MSESDDDEYYSVPLKDQRYFGAGIKRQRIHFVPSSTSESTTPAGASTPSALSASERYLQIVLNKASSEPSSSEVTLAKQSPKICAVCKTQYEGEEAAHCSSLVHQIALPHSHPPSALDRSRKGLSILQSYGWNPDERLGLGAQREGILHPVKAKEKRDTVGLGVSLNNDEPTLKKKRKLEQKTKPVEMLDAGKIRKLELNNKKKHERLQTLFYSNHEVDKYLGAG